MQKNGLILVPIHKVSPTSNFLKKLVTGLDTIRTPKTRNRGTPVSVPGFGQKLGNRIGLTPLL
jgi:hypothetical protein